MDTSSSNNARVIVNPCSINPYGRAAAQLRREQLQSFYGLSSQAPTNQVSVATTMGIQSQRRGGSVKKCQKRGTKVLTKHTITRQTSVNPGGVVFNADLHCNTCRLQRLNEKAIINGGAKIRVPKRAHHRKCTINQKTKGGSEMTAFVNKEAARNMATNRAALKNKTAEKSRQNARVFPATPNASYDYGYGTTFDCCCYCCY